MKFNLLKNYVFHPDIEDNLSLPEDQRLSVEIIRPTMEDHQTLLFIELTQQTQTDSKGKEFFNTASNTRFNVAKILRRHVGEIKNLIIEDQNGKERAVTSGEELASTSFAGMFSLANLICQEVCSDTLSSSQKKIFKSDSTLSGTNGMKGK